MDHVSRVLERRRAGHPDPYKVALCIEGGGMRGVVSAGMVAALQELGGARLFDHVYGSSAGALNGAYFLAGQAQEGLPIYFEELPERRFVSWPRYLRGGPLLHLDDLVDEVMAKVRPLDFDELHRSRPTFHALAYDLAEQEVVAMPEPQDRETLFRRLRATCRVPVFGGPPVVEGEHAWCDPLLHEPIPCRTPLALGATHLVVLSTRPTPAFSRAGVMQRSFEERLLTRWDPRLAASLVADGSSPYDDAAFLAELAEAGRAIVVSPAGPLVGRLETDPEALRAGAQRGRDAVMACEALTGRPAPVPDPHPVRSTTTDVVRVGAAVPGPGVHPQPDGHEPAARRPLPQLAMDGVAWCRESTRRRSAGASELVRRIPRRRRAGDGIEGTLTGLDASPFAALAVEGPLERTEPARRRAVAATGGGDDDVRTVSRFAAPAWTHRVRQR